MSTMNPTIALLILLFCYSAALGERQYLVEVKDSREVPGQDLGQDRGDLTGRDYWFWRGRQRGDFNMTIHVVDQ